MRLNLSVFFFDLRGFFNKNVLPYCVCRFFFVPLQTKFRLSESHPVCSRGLVEKAQIYQ